MRFRKIFFLSSVVVLLPIMIWAQQTKEDGKEQAESFLLDVPSASYKLEAMNRSYVRFCNHSSRTITKFRMGCAEEKDGDLRIINKRPYQDAQLEPDTDGGFHCMAWGANHRLFPLDICKKGKLAIIEVELADGAVWKLRP